jgi:hypothetical protein
MSDASVVELKAESIVYYSQNDEAAFYGWLAKIPCVINVTGRDSMTFMRINVSLVDQYNLRDLLALFHRYKIDMKQLIVFDRPEFSSWFHVDSKYWYEEVFGELR